MILFSYATAVASKNTTLACHENGICLPAALLLSLLLLLLFFHYTTNVLIVVYLISNADMSCQVGLMLDEVQLNNCKMTMSSDYHETVAKLNAIREVLNMREDGSPASLTLWSTLR